MDIRKFFGGPSQKKPVKAIINEEKTRGKRKKKDSDVDGGNHVVQQTHAAAGEAEVKRKKRQPTEMIEKDLPKKQKRQPSKKAVIFDSDSDEEDEKAFSSSVSVKKKPTPQLSDSEEDIEKKSPKRLNSIKPRIKKKEKELEISLPKEKPISADDFFGSTPIQRTSKRVLTRKRGLPVDEEETKGEMEAFKEEHGDDTFQQTLELVDKEKNDRRSRKVKKGNEKEAERDPVEEGNRRANKSPAKFKSVPQKKEQHKETSKPEATPFRKTSPAKPAKSQKKVTPVKEHYQSAEISKQEASPPKKTSPTKPTKLQKKILPVKELNQASPSPSKITKKHSPVKRENHLPTSPDDKDNNNSFSEESKKSGGSTSYRSYLSREGPKALGSKEIPKGKDNCLEGLTFVLTGVFESIERDKMKELVEIYGGKVTSNVSGRTNYLVAGRDSGESKLSKAKSHGTKMLDEDGLFELIKTKPGKKSKYEIQAEKEAKAYQQAQQKKTVTFDKSKKEGASSPRPSTSGTKAAVAATATAQSSRGQQDCSQLLVDKYKPTNLKMIIGQQGEKSIAKKLLRWLSLWHSNNDHGGSDAHKKKQASFKKEDGFMFKAALLSGPPGVGKTTTAQLVCQEAGFTYIELNASDTRSKNTLKKEVAEALNNTTLFDFCGSKENKQQKGLKHCLLMDEVDGMAGNEDRGGMQELIHLIKQSRVPIICMCNDRSSQKIRSLANYCFDLRVQRPRVEQIKGAMMSIAFKEKMKIPAPAMHQIVVSANSDIRQILNNISMWTADEKAMTFEQVKKDSERAHKDATMGPFDVARKVFVYGDEREKMSFNDHTDLFFNDYSLIPLFVQENYPSVNPVHARGDIRKHLALLSKAADSICEGDLVEQRIRRSQQWSLLPLQAAFSTVMPGYYMQGSFGHMINFPSWLGKRSKTTKIARLIQELHLHMNLSTSADKLAINIDYISRLRQFLTIPLITNEADGVQDVVKLMENYNFEREDFDNIMEVGQLEGFADPLKKINPKVKGSFTRTLNKAPHMMPYASTKVKKKKGNASQASEDYSQYGEEESTQNEDSDSNEVDINDDPMIKVKTKTKSEVYKGKGKGTKGSGSRKGKGKR